MVPWTQFDARLDESRAMVARAQREGEIQRALRSSAPVPATRRGFGAARRRVGMAAIVLGQRLVAWGADAGREQAVPA